MIYIAIFILLFITSLIEMNYVIDRKNRFFIFVLLTLVILIGGRYGNGADYYRYDAIFTNININNFYLLDDPGFSAIALGLKMCGFSNGFIFLFFAAIQIGLIGYYIGTNSKYKFPALLVYYSLYMFPFGFNAIAQGISAAIILCSIKFIEEKKVFRVIIMGILAVLFHKVGFIIIIVYIVYNMKLTIRNLIGMIMGLILSSIVLNYLFVSDLLISVLPNDFQNIILSYRSQYSAAIDLVSIAARIVMLLFVSLVFTKYNLNERRTYLVYCIGFAIYVILASNDLLATRINLTFKILEMTLVCGTLNQFKKHETKSIMLIGVSVFLLTVLVSAMRHPELYPYHSWLLKN